tara:strand:+ start:207 stop:479 length:273 start_codon:yes stop_codon:yes gene_type:complete
MALRDHISKKEGALILAIVVGVFFIYLNKIFSLYIDVLLVTIGVLLLVNSLRHVKLDKKYSFYHLILANLYLVVTEVHLLRFIFEFRSLG